MYSLLVKYFFFFFQFSGFDPPTVSTALTFSVRPTLLITKYRREPSRASRRPPTDAHTTTAAALSSRSQTRNLYLIRLVLS